MLANLAVNARRITAFAVVSFFVFPLGAGRIGYSSCCCSFPFCHDALAGQRDGAVLFGLLLLYLVYLASRPTRGNVRYFLRRIGPDRPCESH